MTKSRAASAFRDPTAAKITAVHTRIIETSAKITGMATLRFRRGDPSSRRSRVELADLLIEPYHYMPGASWQGDEQRLSRGLQVSGTPSGMQNRPLFVHLDDRAETITLQTVGDVVLQLGDGK